MSVNRKTTTVFLFLDFFGTSDLFSISCISLVLQFSIGFFTSLSPSHFGLRSIPYLTAAPQSRLSVRPQEGNSFISKWTDKDRPIRRLTFVLVHACTKLHIYSRTSAAYTKARFMNISNNCLFILVQYTFCPRQNYNSVATIGLQGWVLYVGCRMSPFFFFTMG